MLLLIINDNDSSIIIISIFLLPLRYFILNFQLQIKILFFQIFSNNLLDISQKILSYNNNNTPLPLPKKNQSYELPQGLNYSFLTK